jgi:hypothetical protein
MGLTVHVELSLPQRQLSDSAVQALVHERHRAAAAFVRRRGLAGIGPVVPVQEQPFVARWVLIKLDAHTSTGVEVPPLAGWCFAVAAGEGCEPLILGLSRYPATVRDASGQVRRTRLARGWSFACACKTQYADLHGWRHFLKCHRAVVDLALAWERAGVSVSISDEGNYWPGRNTRSLRRQLDNHNRTVAGLAGALKDAADERLENASGADDARAPVQSSIFAHPQFEHLEAEGAGAHGEMLRAAQKVIAGETRRSAK